MWHKRQPFAPVGISPGEAKRAANNSGLHFAFRLCPGVLGVCALDSVDCVGDLPWAKQTQFGLLTTFK